MREPQYFPGLLWKALRKGAALSLLGDKQELLDTRQLIDSAGWKQFQSGGGGGVSVVVFRISHPELSTKMKTHTHKSNIHTATCLRPC